MARWQPDAQGRLRAAAMELYRERGFEQTTVAEIAARAGLTERTFFRHFADKREVLFAGSEEFERAIAEATRRAPAGLGSLDAVVSGLRTACDDFFADRAEFARARAGLIAAHPTLQERELIKMQALGGALAAALRDRGLPDAEAQVAAELGLVVFRVGFTSWIADTGPAPISDHLGQALTNLRAAAAAAGGLGR